MAELDAVERMSESADDVLERRAASLALETIDEEVSDKLSLMLFRIADEWYAVSVSDVREIFQDYEITQIPCVPEFILGVVNVRGEILSVTDPARLMHLGQITPPETLVAPAIVIANDETATAIVVDEIGDIAEVDNGAVEPPVSIIDRAQAEFVSGSVFVDGNMIGVLNVERLLTPIGGSAGKS